MNCLRKLWSDDAGVIISAELVLILTIVVIGVIVGLVQVRDAVVVEFHDISRAISGLNQSYGFSGFHGCLKWNGWGATSWTAGSSFIDVFDGTNTVGLVDLGGYTTGFGGVSVFAGADVGVSVFASYGTIVLVDGTCIPIVRIASGTWSGPGGLLLAATSANATTLRLADGSLIPFLLGRAGTLVLADGTIVVVRPGLNGSLVLPDGSVAVIDTADAGFAVLANGTRVTFRPLDANVVLLPNGTMVTVTVGGQSTLILPDGRVLDLHTAVSLGVNAGAAIGVGNLAYGTIMLKDGTYIPLAWTASGTWSTAGGIVLAATSANATTVRLSDGTTIPFLLGRAGTIVLSDGKILFARPWLNGLLILSDGTVAVIDTADPTIVVLADGSRVTFQPLEANVVMLSSGKIVEVKSVERSTLILIDGTVVDLHNAVLPRELPRSAPDCFGGQPCDHVPAITPPVLQPTPVPEPKLVPEQPQKKPGRTRKTVMAS